MERPLEAGDIVQVIKPEPCCGVNLYLGLVFAIERIATPMELGHGKGHAYCGHCGEVTNDPIVWKFVSLDDNGSIGFHLSTVKRLPSAEEFESEIRKVDVPILTTLEK